MPIKIPNELPAVKILENDISNIGKIYEFLEQ